MSIFTRQFFIQNLRGRLSGKTNSIPPSAGIDSRNISPRVRASGSAASSRRKGSPPSASVTKLAASTRQDQDSSETLYTVDLASDRGPGISAGFEESSTCRGIDLEALVTELESGLESEAASSPEGLEPNLISHLTGAWGEVTSRAFNRADSSEPIRVCVGVESAHYHLSDEVPFDQTLKRDSDSGSAQSNPFGDNVYFLPNAGDFRDIRRGPSDAAGGRGANPKFESDGLPREDEYASFETTAADMSPSGYRLRWLEPFPPNLQTGELIGLRGESDPRWCLAVARWIRQGDEGPFMGVELLAPQARPVAIRVVQTKGGQMGFQPAFLLPDLKPLGRAASLITPPTPFKGGQKVHIRENGIQLTAQLGDCLLKTESFNQFTFRVLDGYLEKPGGRPNMRNQTNKNKHGSR